MAGAPPSCLHAALASLVHDGCLERASFAREHAQTLSHMPVYVAHAAHLRRRRRAIEAQLRTLGAPDVTFVLCADAGEVASLDVATRRCLHPSYLRTAWSPPSGHLSNGTLSLALKHRLAHWHVVQRGLPAALVLEDDALLPADLWSTLAQYRVPPDASLFFLGSYSRSANPRLTLSALPAVEGTSPPVHRRVWTLQPPHILGTVAYVVFAAGARALQLRPVSAEADVDLSLLSPQCGGAQRCANAAPPHQYGPTTWLVWPAAEGNTHASGAPSVRDGWLRHCRERARLQQPLNRNCARFRELRVQLQAGRRDPPGTLLDSHA